MALRPGQRQLLFGSLGLSAVLLLIVPTAFSRLSPFWAYHGTLALYWFGFCLPVALRFGGLRRELLGLELRGAAALAVPLLLGVQCLAVLAGAVLPALPEITTRAVALAIGVALINGPLEEAAWRGAYITTFSDNPRVGYLFGSALFALWHVPLAIIAGVDYPGGWIALVGGAAGLGLFWGAIAWWTRRIGWTVLAHAITNALAFTGLNVLNAWP